MLPRTSMETLDSLDRRLRTCLAARSGNPEALDELESAARAALEFIERDPPDVPVRHLELATLALDVAAQGAARDGTNVQAARLHGICGNLWRRLGPSRDGEAQAAFERALALSPTDGHLWFDLSLLHKWRGRMTECLAAAERARGCLGPERRVLFHTAIAATALGQGAVAQQAYAALGIAATVNRGGMPVVEGLPRAQLRLPSASSELDGAGFAPGSMGFEVVWVEPLSPCHGVVVSATARDTPADYGDVVLWDVAPVSVAEANGEPLPCFAWLGLLARGGERRLRFIALAQSPADVEALSESLPEGAFVAVHSQRIEHLCSRCATGEVLQKHTHEAADAHLVVRGKLIVGAELDLRGVRDSLATSMARGGVRMAVPGLYELLGDAQRAGAEHRHYRSLELAASRRPTPPRDA